MSISSSGASGRSSELGAAGNSSCGLAVSRPHTAAWTLADYAATLRLEQLPREVVGRALDCLIDTVAATIYGHDSEAAKIVLGHVRRASGTGPCTILGALGGAGTSIEGAALANGVLAHAAELDSLRQPGAGVHPGAVLVPVALALGQALGARGGKVLCALVAGIEVLFRIGAATRHSAEARGFHAPGLTGPYGAAVVAARLLGLDTRRTAAALGIAGSLGGGLLEFAESGDGGMVKRLHLGRAAQSGLLAAQLAAAGFEGPSSVLEGRAGFLQAYCAESDAAALVAGLGRDYETLRLCLKRYPCHITAHTVVLALSQLRQQYGFDARRVASVRIESSAKVARLHAIKQPRDLVLAQYSVTFCAAVALARDADDPASFGAASLGDAQVRALCERIEVVDGGQSAWASKVAVTLDDGRTLEQAHADFPGCPTQPLERTALRTKFLRLTTRLGAPGAQALFERLERLEDEPDLNWLGAASQARPVQGEAA